jgi:putative transposase
MRSRSATWGSRWLRRYVCRQMGVSEATFYILKKKYAHLGVSELRHLRSLEDENARLKRLLADLSLDKHILTEALRNKV